MTWAVTITGTPAPKGSMVPFLDRRTGRAQLKEDASPALKSWRKLIAAAGQQIRMSAGDALRQGPVTVEATVTLARPESVKPEKRWWPHLKSPRHGDVDKLARAILDGLTDSGVYTDDAQVCRLVITKTYPDTPGCPDRMDQPGARLRMAPIVDEPILELHVVDVAGTRVDVGHGADCVAVSISVGGRGVAGLALSSTQALRLARLLDHQARSAEEAVLL